MLKLSDVRTIEVKIGEDTWQRAHMEQLEPGDVYRMFEPDGKLVKSHSGVSEFLVFSLPYVINTDGSNASPPTNTDNGSDHKAKLATYSELRNAMLRKIRKELPTQTTHSSHELAQVLMDDMLVLLIALVDGSSDSVFHHTDKVRELLFGERKELRGKTSPDDFAIAIRPDGSTCVFGPASGQPQEIMEFCKTLAAKTDTRSPEEMRKVYGQWTKILKAIPAF